MEWRIDIDTTSSGLHAADYVDEIAITDFWQFNDILIEFAAKFAVVDFPCRTYTSHMSKNRLS